MDDKTLLKRYAKTRDAWAFEQLAHRHAGFVKSVCQRVLGNSHDAEEVTQECFLELARHAGEIHSSVVGWLHRAATSRSLNFLRSRVRRKVRERDVGSEAPVAVSGSDLVTRELRAVIDGALTEMPDELRLPMLLHYFDGRSQRDVALELGVNQSTVSRRMRDALEQLRERLTRSGYVTTAPALVVFMRQQAGATESGVAEIALSTVAEKSAQAAGTVGGFKAFLVSALSLCSLLLVDGWVSLGIAMGLTIYIARSRPQWMADLYASLGHSDLYDQPTYCFKPWDWVIPPADWRGQVAAAMAKCVFFGAVTVAFVVSGSRVPWGSVILGTLVSAGYLIHALRLIHRILALKYGPSGLPIHAGEVTGIPLMDDFYSTSTSESLWLWLDAVQLVGIGLAAICSTMMLMLVAAPSTVWPSAILIGVLGPAMLWAGGQVSRRLVLGSCRESSDEPPSGRSACLSRGTGRILTIGVAVVASLTAWIFCNPSSIRGNVLSIASIQTAMLGWMFFRLAVYCRGLEVRIVRKLALFLLVGCFLLNSSVCLANCWR